MFPRREFLRSSAAALAALSLNESVWSEKVHRPIGLQLYTVRALAGEDLPGLLGRVHDIGYQEVETYWDVYAHPAAELRKMITDHGLRIPSGHFNYDGLSDKFDYAKELGVGFMVCPMLPKNMWNSVDGFKKAAEQFNQWGARAQKMGMQFAFHNHNYEFKKFGGVTGFETLMKLTEPELVAWEMDCYWITQAGLDPVEMMQKYSNRVRMLHLKDRLRGFESSQELNAAAEHFAEVGNGTIDWRQVLATAERQGIKHMFVEQDSTSGDPMNSIRISYKNLENLLGS
jgi:sugar phosphate isomerase/epimerase